MTVSSFIQGVYASLTQQGATLLVNSDNLLTFTNYALTDVYTFEGRFWNFQRVTNQTFTTTGAGSSFTHTIANSDTENVQRLLSLRSSRGTTVYDESVAFKMKQDGIVLSEREVSFVPGSKTFKVFDVANDPIDYEYSYIKGFEPLASLTSELPVPYVFVPALHSLTLSYCLTPFGQYADQKEMNFYQKGLQQLGNLAKYDGMQISSMNINVK